jgi:hypothetical protein
MNSRNYRHAVGAQIQGGPMIWAYHGLAQDAASLASFAAVLNPPQPDSVRQHQLIRNAAFQKSR